MLLVKNERRKRKEFSVKVITCIIGHPFPLKNNHAIQTPHYNE